MYRGIYEFELDAEKCTKVLEMLREKLKANNISLIERPNGTWHLSFVVDNNRKVFAVKQVIRNYDGKVKRHWIFRVNS